MLYRGLMSGAYQCLIRDGMTILIILGVNENNMQDWSMQQHQSEA